MIKFNIQYKQEIQAQIINVEGAALNIREAMKDWRDETIADIKKYLDNDAFTDYPYEHTAEATGRGGGSQVREEHGSEHFLFKKFGQPMGKITYWSFSVENGSPENIGNFILGGTAPPLVDIKPTQPNGLLTWEHLNQGQHGAAAIVPKESRSGTIGREEEFQQEFFDIAEINMAGTKAYLSAMGNNIFSNYSSGSMRGNGENFTHQRPPILNEINK